ncbi:putative acetyl-CoA acetyltransferase [groundwater metagenome]|uniref:Putative acetyl-CoA acetyltransferase n=1 Tax=groundwater metagenome TaxID=717931 RepID=A0A098ECT0_9ZZZZ
MINTHIIGTGRTKFGVLNENIPELSYEAMFKSLEDSTLSINDIDAIYVANFCAGPFQNQLHLNSVISSLLPKSNIPIIRIETACASASSALYQAIISLNKFENIMVLGVEKMTDADNLSASKNISSAGDRLLDQDEGLIFPAEYALIAQQHMLEYGTTLDDLALVSLKNHNNANLNDLAHFYHKKVDIEMIKNSPVVCSPLRLFDCSPVSDGAAAVIISRNKKTDRNIKIAASAIATDTISLCQRENLTSFNAAKIAAKEAYKQANIKPEDIDIAEVHDCFTISELIAMEDVGLCKEGESKYLIRDGKTNLRGDIPINTDGGLKADGHPIGASGVAQIIEVVTQLRGEAGKRQVQDAEVGLTHNIGGIGGTAVIHILKSQ